MSSPEVLLRGDGSLPWRPVSPSLARVRLITLVILLVPPLIATLVLGTFVSPWFWIASAAIPVLGTVLAWVIGRGVSAISWIELEEEIIIRKGRVLRRLVSVPYGRLQYVDLQSGPLMRAFGLASCEIHTASPESGGSIPGLPAAEAEALRARLAARGEAQRAGL